MKYLLVAVALLLSTSCAAQEVTQSFAGEVLVKCEYKYDKSYNVEFLKRNREEYYPPQFPNLLVYRIKDTHGANWAINQYEWADYTCTETIIPQG